MTILFRGARKLDVDGIVDDFWMCIDGATIVSTGIGAPPHCADTIDVGGRFLVPGFIDLHGHGGGGHSFDDGRGEIEAALTFHRRHGTTRSIVSLVANPVASVASALGVIADIVDSDPLVLGSHLEGPYLSPLRRGAHHPDHLRVPDRIELDELIDASRGTLRQLTIAPELPGALDAIEQLVARDVIVAIGHTEADYALTRDAFDRGARILTHAFNAMPGIGHRAPGPVVAALQDERVVIELILDGTHVHPDVASMVFRAAPARVALITDAMAAAGSLDGDYLLGSLAVSVRDGVAVLAGTSTIAGSTLTQDVALRIAIDEARVPPALAVAALTDTPARALRLDDRLGRIRQGFAADVLILGDDWSVEAVWADGSRLV